MKETTHHKSNAHYAKTERVYTSPSAKYARDTKTRAARELRRNNAALVYNHVTELLNTLQNRGNNND